MELSQLNNLIRDENQNGLYDLMVFDFKTTSVQFAFHYVDSTEVMRIDLVNKNIYHNDVDSTDFLLSLNGIDNPLNIMEGDIIAYCDYEYIDLFKTEEVSNSIQTGSFLLNPNKSVKKDSKRAAYVDNNYALPPTYNQSEQPSVQIDGNKIKLG